MAGQDGSKELWGSNYYILPAKTEFKDKHPQAGKANLKQPDAVNGIEFPPQTAGINEKKLYVETYYDKGERYTRVWEARGGPAELDRFSVFLSDISTGF